MNTKYLFDLRNYASKVGVTLPEIIVDSGEIQRFHVRGEKRGSSNGWYIFNSTHNVCRGVFGNWRTGEYFKWSSTSADRISVQDLYLSNQAIKKQAVARAKRALADQRAAADRAKKKFEEAKPVLNSHPYLVRKNIPPVDARQIGENLVVPIYGMPEQIVNLQYISPAGGKWFEKGASKKRCYGKLGRSVTDDAWLCEGYATAVSLHLETDQTVFWGIDANNLVPVAEKLKHLYQNVSFTVCADNDRFHSCGRNVGLIAAEKAQLVFSSGSILIPNFKCAHAKCTDFNDWVNCPEGGYKNDAI